MNAIMPILPLDHPEPLAATLGVMLYPGEDDADQKRARAYAAQFLAKPVERFREAGGTLTAEVLARLEGALELGTLPSPRVLARCARYLRSRHELNRRFAAEIQHTTGLPIVELPRLAEGIQSPDQISSLASALLADPVFLE